MLHPSVLFSLLLTSSRIVKQHSLSTPHSHSQHASHSLFYHASCIHPSKHRRILFIKTVIQQLTFTLSTSPSKLTSLILPHSSLNLMHFQFALIFCQVFPPCSSFSHPFAAQHSLTSSRFQLIDLMLHLMIGHCQHLQ